MAYNIAKDGKWKVEAVNLTLHQLVQYGTCAYRVRTDDRDGHGFCYVGNEDIIRNVWDAIANLLTDSKVQGTGTITCQGSKKVKWTMYHVVGLYLRTIQVTNLNFDHQDRRDWTLGGSPWTLDTD